MADEPVPLRALASADAACIGYVRRVTHDELADADGNGHAS